MSGTDVTGQVQGDVRRFIRAAVVAVAAEGLLGLWQINVLSQSGGRVATLVIALVAATLAVTAWRKGNRRLRARLYVLSPVFLAGLPIVACVGSFGGPIAAFFGSFLLALAAAAAFGYTRPRRNR